MRVTGLRWRKGWDDVVPLAVWASPMLVQGFLPGARTSSVVLLVVAAAAVGLGLKHLLPAPYEDVAVIPPAVALLVEISTIAVSVEGLLLSAVAGVGLLVWIGAEPTSGVSVRRLLEPAVVPALAVGVALAVMLFLPVGTGAQVGLAALALVAVLGLVAWLYLRSVDETALPGPTS
jgi:hypothetical protein